MKIRQLVTAMAIGAIIYTPLALGQDVIYRWTDENGVVHQGEQPPEGVDAVIIQAKAPPPIPKKTPLADDDFIEMSKRCNAAREAEIRACENEDPDNSGRCSAENASFAKKLANLPDCVALEAEAERLKGER